MTPRTAAPAAKGGGIMIGTMKLAGFIFALVFLLSIGTCVFFCGSVAVHTTAK
jgi:hypothetical protein